MKVPYFLLTVLKKDGLLMNTLINLIESFKEFQQFNHGRRFI